MSKSSKLLTVIALNSASISSFAGEYIVCKDLSNGTIKCEDGYYKETGESASELNANLAKDKGLAKPQLSVATVKRIASLVDEIKSKSNGKLDSMSSDEVLSLVSNSTSIEPARAKQLVQELKGDSSIKYAKPGMILEKISSSKVMI